MVGLETALMTLSESTERIEISRLTHWDHKPLSITDAIDRTYAMPIEACSSFEVCGTSRLSVRRLIGIEQDFQILLQRAFFRSAMSPLVENGQFWIFTPVTHERWDLIHPNDWQAVCKPGAVFGMSFFVFSEDSATLEDADVDNAETLPAHPRESRIQRYDPQVDETGEDVSDLIKISEPSPVWWKASNVKFHTRYV